MYQPKKKSNKDIFIHVCNLGLNIQNFSDFLNNSIVN